MRASILFTLSVLFAYNAYAQEPQNALPVKLIILSVHQSEKEALLAWQTASEENSDLFDVERSINNKSWSTIEHIAAAGNSSEIKHYAYTDPIEELLNRDVKTIYYRLKQVDKDGTIAYSNIITVNLRSAVETLTAYPMPMSDLLTVETSSRENILQVSVTDLSGKVVLQSNAGSQVDVSSLSSGSYILKVTSDRETYYRKIVK